MTPSGRLAGWDAAHPEALDAVLALSLDGIALAGLALRGPDHWDDWLLVQGLSLPVIWRRRAPSAVFVVLAGVALVQWAVGLRLLGDVSILLTLYSVTVLDGRRRGLLAAGASEVGVVMASIRLAPAGDGVVGSIVFLSGLVLAAFFIGTTRRARLDQLGALRERAARLERERDQQALLVATAESTRIARELHDIVAHSLSVVTVLADGAVVANADGSPVATEAMRQVAATGREAMGEMRRLLGVLHDANGPAPAELAPQPGLERVDDLVNQIRATGLSVTLKVTGAPSHPVSAIWEATAYRCVQESLTNVLKHAAGAGRAEVVLGWTDTGLAMRVTDDGRPDACPPGPGTPDESGLRYGLAGMRERLGLFGGTLRCGPGGTGGWEVSAELPYEPRPPTSVPWGPDSAAEPSRPTSVPQGPGGAAAEVRPWP